MPAHRAAPSDHLPKYAKVLAHLQAVIRAAAPGTALPTITALRAEFGVSQATIDRALGELRAQGLIESRRGAGTFVSGRLKRRHYGLLFSHILFDSRVGTFYHLLFAALQRRLEASGALLRLYVPNSPDADVETKVPLLVADAQQGLVDGLILIQHWRAHPLPLSIPVVSLGRLPFAAHRVIPDDLALARCAAHALFGRQCRRAAFIGLDVSQDGPLARDVFLREAARLGIAANSDATVIAGGYFIDGARQSGREAFHALWARLHEKPDGLVVMNEYVAQGVIAAMGELGLRPGRELVVVSHVTKGASVLTNTEVIRMEDDPDDIAAGIVEALDSAMDGSPCTDRFVAPRSADTSPEPLVAGQPG